MNKTSRTSSRLHFPSEKNTQRYDSGFALVTSLIFLAILLGLIVALASTVGLTQRSDSMEQNAFEARQSALAGLKIAIGELQEAAGVDQRVTATADILSSSENGYTNGLIAEDGRKAWTGVWKSNTSSAAFAGANPPYTPEEPENKGNYDAAGNEKPKIEQKFVGWLVSSSDADGNFALPKQRSDTYGSASSQPDGLDLEEPVVLSALSDGTPHLEAGKAILDQELSSSGDPLKSRQFAFAVEDESTKADLLWTEGSSTSTSEIQQTRLSSAQGPDYAVLNGITGPFNSITYPISEDDNEFLATGIEPIRDTADLQSTLSASPSWLKDQRSHITSGSFGVLADVKKGGLRRDLSLAFEMDGNDDVDADGAYDNDSSILGKFNNQAGEFVGGGDTLAAQMDAPGLSVRERYLWRNKQNDGSPFSADILRSGDKISVRGPNWWALRDFYNLYKRVELKSDSSHPSGRSFALTPRAYYPNNSASPNIVAGGWLRDNNYRYLNQPGNGTHMWDIEKTANDQHVYHPARANYAPILMGTVGLYSAKIVNDKLAVVIDPLIYLWNPYNIKLDVKRYGVALQRGHGGKITFEVIRKDAAGNVTDTLRYGPAKTDVFIQRKMRDSGQASNGHLTYLASDITMEPGEILVLSPTSGTANATELHDAAFPGTNLTENSGIEVTVMPKEVQRIDASGNPVLNGNGDPIWDVVWEEVPLDEFDEVRCLYDVMYSHKANTNIANSAEHFWMASFLPNDDSVKPKDIINADSNSERIQTFGGNFAGRNWAGISENLVPNTGDISKYPSTSWPSFTVSSPASAGKFFFGINSHTLKPTAYTDLDGNPMPNQNPVEIFTQFNPFRIGSFVEGHRVCRFNETYSSISEPGSINNYIQKIGVQFDPSANRRGYWGQTYHGNGGSTAVPFIEIPTAPPLSLMDFANANLSLRTSDPYKKVGNSHASIFTQSDTIYGQPGISAGTTTECDTSWLINDALFDRYFLSGIAPAYNRSSGIYQTEAPIGSTLEAFLGNTAENSSPAIRAYIPAGKKVEDILTELDPKEEGAVSGAGDGYKKLAAYSMINGAFNVNSTSTKAWEALLRSNRSLSIQDSAGGNTASTNETPFPNSKLPAPAGNGANSHWAGFSTLEDSEITQLAESIVDQVKARGPFMSLSDFVNRQVSDNTDLNAAGAIQQALDDLAAVKTEKESAGGLQPVDPSNNAWRGPNFAGDADLSDRLSTEGISTDIRQADLLRALTPRLTARADTFRIRSYGEVKSEVSGKILSKAVCEAVVQRVPEYVDETDEPWDEGSEITSKLNQMFGRKFKVIQLRWLAPDEV